MGVGLASHPFLPPEPYLAPSVSAGSGHNQGIKGRDLLFCGIIPRNVWPGRVLGARC